MSIQFIVPFPLPHHLVIIMCANPKTIREIMIAADELNMIDSGEYVFINIEIFGSLKKDPRPWYEPNDDGKRNEMAKKAYQALMTITTRKPQDDEYQNFSDEVSEISQVLKSSRIYWKSLKLFHIRNFQKIFIFILQRKKSLFPRYHSNIIFRPYLLCSLKKHQNYDSLFYKL